MNENKLAETRSIIEMIRNGDNPSVIQIESIIPYLKIAMSQLKDVEDHIRERARKGEEFNGVKVSKPVKSKKVKSAISIYKKLKDKLGDKFDPTLWNSLLTINVKDVNSFYCKCLNIPKSGEKSSEEREQLDFLIEPDLDIKETESRVTIGAE